MDLGVASSLESYQSLPLGNPANPKLPTVEFGFLLENTICLSALVGIWLGYEDIDNLVLTAGFANVSFWVYCVYRFHQALAELTDHKYPIRPVSAFYLFIPLHNILWTFRWTNQLSKFINGQGLTRMAPGIVLGALLLLSSVMLVFEWHTAFTIALIVGIYIRHKLARHMKAGNPYDLSEVRITWYPIVLGAVIFMLDHTVAGL